MDYSNRTKELILKIAFAKIEGNSTYLMQGAGVLMAKTITEDNKQEIENYGYVIEEMIDALSTVNKVLKDIE